MRRWIFVGLVAVSCSKMSLFPQPRSRTEAGGRRPVSETEAGQRDLHVYLTAVVWPEDYDWQRDTAAAEPSLLLLRDGETWLRTALLDGSVHRWRNGHLWESGFRDGVTLLLRDGKEFARWEGEEALKGFLTERDGVYTLTQRVGTPGVRLRRSGELLFADDRGTVLGSMDESGWDGGALAKDAEELCYGYFAPSDGGRREFRFMEGTELFRLVPPEEWTEIYDARRLGGILYRTQADAAGLFLLADGGNGRIPLPAGSRLNKLLPHDESLLVFGFQESEAWTRHPQHPLYSFPAAKILADYYTDGTAEAWIETDADGRVVRLAAPHEPDRTVFLQGDYRLMAPVCGMLRHGHFAAGLTDLDGRAHLLCLDGMAIPLRFNGYITSICLE